MTYRRAVLTTLAALLLASILAAIFTDNSDFGDAAIILGLAFAAAALAVDE